MHSAQHNAGAAESCPAAAAKQPSQPAGSHSGSRLSQRAACHSCGAVCLTRDVAVLTLAAASAFGGAQVVGGDDGESAEDQWVLCSEPVPQPPEGAKLMASEHLPISV